MINYYWNYLFNECQDVFIETYRHLLDTGDFVPKEDIEAIQRHIMKRQKKAWKQIAKEVRRYNRQLRKTPLLLLEAPKPIQPESTTSDDTRSTPSKPLEMASEDLKAKEQDLSADACPPAASSVAVGSGTAEGKAAEAQANSEEG